MSEGAKQYWEGCCNVSPLHINELKSLKKLSAPKNF